MPQSYERNGFYMKKIICENYSDMSSAAADIIAEQLSDKPNSVFGLATGSTPVGLYQELVRRYNEGKIDFSKAISFNLDEYYPIKSNHPQSYNMFMKENLFNHVNFLSTDILNGEADNPTAECLRYDEAIDTAGGIDIQILGIGFNGHIGFNEPSTVYSLNAHLENLTQSTLEANSRFFDEGENQPTESLTVGFGTIFKAKKVLLLISGAAKAEIAKKLFENKIYVDMPASLLHLHPNVTVIMDKDAVSD